MKKALLIGSLSILLLIVVLGVCGYFYYDKNTYTLNEEEFVYEIESGSSVKKVAQQLSDNNIVKNKLIFEIYYKANFDGKGFVAGEYLLEPNTSFDTLMKKFIDGDYIPIETNKVTIQEGLTTEQTLTKLSESLNLDIVELNNLVINGDWDYWFLEGIERDEHMLDGFLFPDTYEFAEDVEATEVITRLLNRTEKELDKFREEINSSDLNVREIMTIASLIEKEARHDEDRPSISGVIYNRLEQDMLLQIDATVLAVVGHKQVVTYDDLKVDSPYNTYKYKGLPPSPIAMPGAASIEAALYPEEHDYLFYVANRETGYHHFAETFEEHEENIDKYWRISKD